MVTERISEIFCNTANQGFYAFDSTALGTASGALKASTRGGGLIKLLPVTLRQVAFTYAMDVASYGTVVTFNNITPIYTTAGTPTGMWITVEYPPTITVTAES